MPIREKVSRAGSASATRCTYGHVHRFYARGRDRGDRRFRVHFKARGVDFAELDLGNAGKVGAADCDRFSAGFRTFGRVNTSDGRRRNRERFEGFVLAAAAAMFAGRGEKSEVVGGVRGLGR